jgi:phosphatidylinositol alpha-1,6-mannosyltransferase
VRILVPTADYPPIEGGISTLALNVSRELAAMGHEVTVVAPWFGAMDSIDRKEPVRVLRFRGYGFGWARLLPMAARCAKELRRTDLVLSINISYGGLVGMAGKRFFGVPYVAFAYGYEFLKFPRRSPVAALVRAAYRRAVMVAAISRYTRDELIRFGVDAAAIEVCLPGAARTSPPTPAATAAIKTKLDLNGHRLLLSVGRMVPRKGHLTLVRAMPRVLGRHPDAVLVCAGRGPCRDDAKRLAAELGVSDRVRLPGHLTDVEVNALYEACEIFALPAGTGPRGQVEGFGLVFAEAAARGKPVIAGRSGGMPDAVLEGETGFLVESGDADGAAAAIDRLLSDGALARRMGEAGRLRVDRELNWPVFTRSIMEAYARRS